MALTTNQLVYGVFGIAAGGYTDAVEDFVAVNGEDATANALMNISYLNPTLLGIRLYNNAQYADVLVGHLMGGLNDTLEAAVAQIVVDYMAANPTLGRGAVAVDLIEALLAVPDGDRNFGEAKAAYLAKVALADAYTGTSTNVIELAAVVGDVNNYVDANQTIELTVGQDTLAGAAGNDTFEANVVQNSLGLQVNTLGSGDKLSGLDGADTLNAKITAGAFAGGSDTMPIQPETSSIETINLQAVLADINWPETVYVNAKDMLGVESISSDHSDASLVVQNMTTLDNDGSTRALSEMTVGMKYTGNSDHDWDESDLAVYFDQDYLNPELTRGLASVSIKVINEDAYDLDNTTPLAGVDFGSFYITVNGAAVDLANNTALLGANTINAQIAANGMETYADLLAYVSNAIDAWKAAEPDNAALQTLQAELGSNFLSDENRVGTTLLVSVDAGTGATPNTIEATEVFDIVAQEGVFLQPISESGIPNSNRYEDAGATPADEGQILEIDIDLEKVGLAGDGGMLTVGSMFKDGQNVWSDLYDGKGIEQFNVTVYGDDSKPSSLSSLASTGNNLRVVNVVSDANQTGTYASLTIGNSESAGALGAEFGADNTSALKDVQTFDATGFNGDLTLFAGLSDEVVAKYLDRMDDDADPAADNDAFTYSGGAGDDSINLAINFANLAAAGTATREDMSVTINGGAGNDTIIQAVVDGLGLGEVAATGNWYLNQQINANLAINGGAGDDTIWTPGSGDVVINAGAGADTVYTDNTGALTSATVYTITLTADGLDDNSETISIDGAVAGVFAPDINVTSLAALTTYVANAYGSTNFDTVAGTVTVARDSSATAPTVTFGGTLTGMAAAVAAAFPVPVTFNDGRATWVANSVNLDINDLQSNTAAATVTAVEAALTVTYMGFTTAQIEIADSWGATSNVSINDLHVNQAIKDAINNDAELSKLLVAEDGPARTLVIRSLIDGTQVVGDLTIDLLNHTGGVAPVGTELFAADANFAALEAIFEDETLAQENGVDLVGADSTATSDNRVEGSTGDDVIVLGTTVGLVAASSSNDTLVYNGFANGTDTVVNFLAGALTNGQDAIDFSSYNAEAVIVNHAVVADQAFDLAAVGEQYVLLTESTTNVGAYTMSVYTEVGITGDILVGTIGTIDFGATQAFHVDNFII